MGINLVLVLNVFSLIPGNMTALVWYCLLFFEILWLVMAYIGEPITKIRGKRKAKAFHCLDSSAQFFNFTLRL